MSWKSFDLKIFKINVEIEGFFLRAKKITMVGEHPISGFATFSPHLPLHLQWNSVLYSILYEKNYNFFVSFTLFLSSISFALFLSNSPTLFLSKSLSRSFSVYICLVLSIFVSFCLFVALPITSGSFEGWMNLVETHFGVGNNSNRAERERERELWR